MRMNASLFRQSNKRAYLPLGYSIMLVMVLLTFAACNNNTLFMGNNPVNEDGWEKNQPLVFEIPVADTTGLHTMHFLLRHTTDYPFSNLYVFLDIEFPDNRIMRDTLECILADRTGKWTGKGFGRIKSSEYLFRDNVWFPDSGTYTIRIRHGMRTNPLPGISDAGIMIRKK